LRHLDAVQAIAARLAPRPKSRQRQAVTAPPANARKRSDARQSETQLVAIPPTRGGGTGGGGRRGFCRGSEQRLEQCVGGEAEADEDGLHQRIRRGCCPRRRRGCRRRTFGGRGPPSGDRSVFGV